LSSLLFVHHQSLCMPPLCFRHFFPVFFARWFRGDAKNFWNLSFDLLKVEKKQRTNLLPISVFGVQKLEKNSHIFEIEWFNEQLSNWALLGCSLTHREH
jgi:hypothetical protein